MLLSEKYKFIFIHNPKTGGTSIESALLPFAVDGFQKKIIEKFQGRRRIHINSILKRIFPSNKSQSYSNHISPKQLIECIGYDEYKEFYSFAFVRNPWAKLVSDYLYILKTKHHPRHRIVKKMSDFDDFINHKCVKKIGVRFQKNFLFNEDSEQLVDYIGKLETINDDFNYICDKLNINAYLPRLNVSKTKKYQSYYNDKTIDLVYTTYKKDIAFFNYSF